MKIATVLVAFVCLFITLFCIGQNPGLKVRINSRGLNFGKTLLLDYLKPRLSNLKIPNFSGGNYAISNVKIDSFNLGSSQFSTRYPNFFKASVSGASAKVSGSWKAWKKVLFFTIRASGTASVSASRIDMSQEVAFGKTSSGKPTGSIEGCLISIGSFNISLKGKNAFLSWVYNVIIGFFEDRIKREVQKAICRQARKVLQDKSDDITNDFNVNFPFLSRTRINLGLTRNPQSTSSSLTVSLKGRCYATNNQAQSFPFSPPTLPSLSSSSKMVKISLGEYVLNTLLYSMWKNGAFTRVVGLRSLGGGATANVLVPAIPSFAQYGNRPLQVRVVATSAPKANFYTSGVVITGKFNLELNIIYPIRVQKGVVINVNVRIEGKPKESNNKFSATISHLSVIATGSNSNALSTDQINGLIQSFLPSQIVPVLKGLAEAGFKIPSRWGLKATGITLALKSNAIEIGSDFSKN